MDKRNPVFDLIKAILMVSIISGHLEGNCITGCGDEMLQPFLGNLRLGVSMPLFFMISGLFAARTLCNAASYESKIIARTLSFLWPLFSFGVLFGLTLLAFGMISPLKAAVYPLMRVCFGGWFLRTLAIIYLMTAIVCRMFRTTRLRLLVLGLVYVGLFFAPRGGVFFWTGMVMHMFPYFVFGVFVLSKYKLYQNAFVAIPCSVAFFAVLTFEGKAVSNGMGFYWVPTEWRTVLCDGHLMFCFFARTAVGIIGGVSVLWLADRMVNVFPKIEKLAVFGTTSLGVYVVHEWPIIQAHNFFSFDPLPGMFKWPMAVLIFLMCHYFVIAIKRMSAAKFFFFGDERWVVSKVDSWMLCLSAKSQPTH